MEEWDRAMRIFRALEDLDGRLAALGVAPFALNVIEGFALLLEGVRRNVHDYTDIDHISQDFNKQIREMIQEVGVNYGFEKNWINNEVILSGSNLKHIELATGKLHFVKRAKLSVITVYSLNKESLLRMKVIAIDTSLFAFFNDGAFPRIKDFPDVKILMDHMGCDFQQMKAITQDYVLEPMTYSLIDYHIQTGKLDMFVKERFKEIVNRNTFSAENG